MAERKKITDTDRAARFVWKHFPDMVPNGWLVDELRELLQSVRRDEREKAKSVGIVTETKGKPPADHGGDDDCG
jgi:hypothetical protein